MKKIILCKKFFTIAVFAIATLSFKNTHAQSFDWTTQASAGAGIQSYGVTTDAFGNTYTIWCER